MIFFNIFGAKELTMDYDDLTVLQNQISQEPMPSYELKTSMVQLDTSNPERWIFRKSMILKMMIIVAAIYAVMLITSWLMGAEILVGIMGGTLLVGSISMLLKDCSKQIFDFKKGCYVHWRLRRTASGVINFGCDKCMLDDIAALQVIKKRNQSKDKTVHYTYELNIIEYDGTRINLTTYRNIDDLEYNACKLADGLGVPIWGWPEKDWENYGRVRKGKLVTILFGLVFVCVGVAILWWVTILPVKRYLASQSWVITPATIISSQFDSKMSHRSGKDRTMVYRADIIYEYWYEDRMYRGNRYDVADSGEYSDNGVDEMRQAVQKYPYGKSTYCWVNPDNPNEAILERNLMTPRFLTWTGFPFIFIFAGISTIVSEIIRHRREQN